MSSSLNSILEMFYLLMKVIYNTNISKEFNLMFYLF